MYKYSFKYLFLVFFLFGCSVKPVKVQQQEIVKLSILLQNLDKRIPKKETVLLSENIFDKTKKLTQEFELTKPALWHNFLVNVGIREKGLCYHWSDAFYVYFKEKNSAYFSFHLVGANIGEYFSEHNALVIMAKGKKNIEKGIIIDPWRDSGKLYFSIVYQDKKYRWQHRRDRGCSLK